MNRVTNITWRTASGTRIGGFAYRYDALGRIVSRTHDLGTNRFDRTYAYDDMDRLASDGGTAYAYDAAGNRTSRTEGGETVSYALGQGDRLAAWTGGSYQYDDAGCVTRITRGADTWDLTWNGQYQLVSVSTNGAFAEAYAYDALGRRVTTRNAEGTERHVYDDNWQVVADLDANGNVMRSYVWGEGIDRLLEVKIGSKTYTALTDVQGTVWGYADEQGDVVAKWTYDAWGNVLTEDLAESAAELRAVRYRFQGRERSAATGLANFRMRWYDAITGRWLSKDPIGLSGGLNLYAFCGGDPMDCIDPNGLSFVGVLHDIAKIVSGLSTAVAGATLGVGSSWTGAGAVVGGIVFVVGIDQATEGLNSIFNRVSGMGPSNVSPVKLFNSGVSFEITGTQGSQMELVLNDSYEYMGDLVSFCSGAKAIMSVRGTVAFTYIPPHTEVALQLRHSTICWGLVLKEGAWKVSGIGKSARDIADFSIGVFAGSRRFDDESK